MPPCGNHQRQQCNDDVQRDGDVGRDRDVVDAQQVEASHHAADDRPGGVATVEEPKPRTPLGVVSIQRAMAGRVAPMSNVGGRRQIAANTPRMTMPTMPLPAQAV
jgi:hypothetical protein